MRQLQWINILVPRPSSVIRDYLPESHGRSKTVTVTSDMLEEARWTFKDLIEHLLVLKNLIRYIAKEQFVSDVVFGGLR